MKTKSNRRQTKRLGAMAVAAMMLLQAVGPVYAVVSQLPGLYTAPPEPNVMFTLDDSGSMQADAIPDFNSDTAGMPPGIDSNFFGLLRYPNMWGSNSLYRGAFYYQKGNAIARYMRSSAGNPLYYDRRITYLPWPTAADDKVLSANATSTAVRISTDTPFSGGTTIDLTARVNVSGGAGAADNDTKNYWPATYFVYTGATPLPLAAPNTGLNTIGNFTKVEIKSAAATPTFARATKVVAGLTVLDDARTDCGTGALVCTHAQELKNFANWLQYYRNRRLMAKGGVAAAFAKQGTNLRVGFASINSSPVVRRGVRNFSGAARTAFYNDLYPLGNQASVFTPLRKAMDDVGAHFTTTDVNSPWAQSPGTSIGTEFSCRRNFHFLSTDGYWNDASASSLANNNNDNFSGETPPMADGITKFTYSDASSQFMINPFADGNPDTLADVAAYYWKTDLRSDTLGSVLVNDVVPTARDPAFWQHLTTFTIGLGISGSGEVRRNSDGSKTIPAVASGHPLFPYIGQPWLANQDSRDWLVANKTKLDWTTPSDDNPATGDDLIHASMNGRGRYFSATNPTDLAAGLSSALAEVTTNPGSLANVVTETPQVSADTEVYQATYTPSQWSGRLYAFSQSASGVVNTKPTDTGSGYTNPSQKWEASNKMLAPADRKIYTWNPTTKGTLFKWGNLTTTQKSNLSDDSTLLDYLRGSETKEVAQGGPFRNRARYTIGAVKGGVLGDIVNGSPIKGPSAGGGYERLPTGVPGQGTYKDYRATGNTKLNNMRNTLFASANDGMLHAFDLTEGVKAGEERFAFVPNSVFSVPRSLTGTELKLKMLSDPNYSHRYTVDGPPQIGDAFIGTGAAAADWKTVLLGSTGAGARSVFALDISNPMDITDPAVTPGAYPRFDQNKLLWEFSEANNSDMGYVIGYPHIARTKANADGTGGAWVAIFGNGYDSTNGQAKLFILNLQTGAVVWERSVGAAGGNGLSQPNFTVNNKREVTAIYAGDLKGNLWKFDVDNPDSTQWKVAFGGAPLFTGATTQPITVMPEITYHPNGGTLLSFGTGKLFDVEDTAATGNVPPNVNLNTQAIYGIWDKPGEATGFSGNGTLVPRLGAGLPAAADGSLSGTTSQRLGGGAGETVVDWTTHRGWYLNLGPGGERVNVNPFQAKSTLLVVANKADSDPCKSAGSSRLFALDPITGGAPGFGVFDSNGDTKINSADKGYNVKSFSSAVLSLPALQTKKEAFTDQVVTERVGTRGQTGERLGGVENKPTTASDCKQWLLAGGSDTSIAGFDISLCAAGKPRVSWRQLK